jgi:hypothetical protein
MSAAEARQLVRDLDVEDAAAKVVADASPLSEPQVEILRAVLAAPVEGESP